MAEDIFAIFLQAFLVGRLVDAVNRRAIQAHQPRGDGFIGQQHAFLDELVGDVVLDFLDAQHPAGVIQANLGFRKVQVQRAGLEAGAANLLRQGVGVVQHALERVRAARDGEWPRRPRSCNGIGNE